LINVAASLFNQPGDRCSVIVGDMKWSAPLCCLLLACTPPGVAPAPLEPGAVFRSSGSSFAAGPLEVQQVDLKEGEAGAPRALRIHAPIASGTYPVVQFQHGFLLDRRAYDEILSHLASHGFVVVAPQMYPADGVPLGKETAFDEADDAVAVATWSLKSAAAVVGSAADPRPIGLAGHSRGGKVAWTVATASTKTRGPLPLRALVGVDPVDGKGGPLLSAQAEAVPSRPEESLASAPPSLLIGMELSGSCAPAGDNFRHFFDHTTAPTRLVEVLGHGHTDMLDADADTGGLCFEGPERAAVRTLTGGLLAAFFRLQLQDDPSVLAELDASSVAPLEVTHESR
jgi:chlorophyllase